MTDRELMQQALNVLNVLGMNYAISAKHWPQTQAAITALRDRLAQPEPVTGNLLKDAYNAMVEKKTRSQRPWVGLTDAEVKEIIDKYTIDDHGFEIWCDGLGVVKAVNDKLRSKNT